jgi:hypothetical protein
MAKKPTEGLWKLVEFDATTWQRPRVTAAPGAGADCAGPGLSQTA